jgi:small GTP-binding protein
MTAGGPSGSSGPYRLKLLLVGNSGVGKSCMLNQFIYRDRWFGCGSSTIGVDFITHTMHSPPDPISSMMPSKAIKLQIWDTGGRDKFKFISRSYYTNSHGIMFVYDASNRESFFCIREWVEEAMKHQKGAGAHHMLVGNKKDELLLQTVSVEEGQRFARGHGMLFVEVGDSAGVDTAFNLLIDKCLQDDKTGSNTEHTPLIRLTQPHEYVGCCA